MSRAVSKLTLQEFLALPESGNRCELVDGELVPKMSPTSSHSRAQKRLLRFLDDWCEQSGQGEVNPEWTVVLKRHGVDWAPVPDLTYISQSRVPADWDEEGPCSGTPELVVEIISPGQTFGELTQKATDYLLAGVDRVWVVDTKAQSVTIFRRDNLPQTVRGDGSISDPLLPELVLPIAPLFSKTPQGN
jgi:Uma2 family endonuclease